MVLQYSIVGIALSLFYLILLALAEHIGLCTPISRQRQPRLSALPPLHGHCPAQCTTHCLAVFAAGDAVRVAVFVVADGGLRAGGRVGLLLATRSL